jgi:hypothetical protein
MELDKDDVLKWTRSEWPAHIPRIGYAESRERLAHRSREAFSYLASLLALVGILIYGMLSISYDAFYRPLGVDPDDIGLNYGKVLGQSTGIVVFLASAAAAFSGILWLSVRLERSIKGVIARQRILPRRRRTRGVPWKFAIIVFALELLVV